MLENQWPSSTSTDGGDTPSPPPSDSLRPEQDHKTAARQGALDTPDRSLNEEIAGLPSLDIHALRTRWRKLFRKTAPEHLPRALLQPMIAWRLQARAFRDLDPKVAKYLDGVARDRERRKRSGEKRKAKAAPQIRPFSGERALPLGTVLVREHDGVMHNVMAVRDGYLWQEQTFTSLSAVAGAITGTNWNGHRFFGLDRRGTARETRDYVTEGPYKERRKQDQGPPPQRPSRTVGQSPESGRQI